MNKNRKKQIEKASLEFTLILARIENEIGNLEQLKETLENIKDGEQEAFDNMPESLQGGEQGDRMEQAINYIESAIGDIESLIEAIQNPTVVSDLDEATSQ